MAFKNCYVKAIIHSKNVEWYTKEGKYLFLPEATGMAILHETQANDPVRLNKIQFAMWQDLCNTQGWAIGNEKSYKSKCSFEFIKIPKKSQPITYRL